ncbi:hypothetical protein D9K79_08060 [Acinetobacter cumulans]|uniref:Uncharacterized protein n=1 Tax=Acinetobacter cumulans TaxID=2136182 RepID=A0A498D665_9GAMM|nr:hypothetical protein [Acinetobacter cumulans]RLL33760.1 hypothetical protein D9K80_12670 [Acinetobacter cumulans]RLL46396.1 hypothetical protein D9K79_08060 [Acinetobacter cumulans]
MSLINPKRTNRKNVNLTNDELDLFTVLSKMTGIPVGILLRQMAMKQAFELVNDESVEQYQNEGFKKGVLDHL